MYAAGSSGGGGGGGGRGGPGLDHAVVMPSTLPSFSLWFVRPLAFNKLV